MSKTTIYYLFLVAMYMLLGQVERRDMKQTVEEAAKEYAELIVKPQEMYLSFEGVYSLKEDLFNSFSAGAEWKLSLIHI